MKRAIISTILMTAFTGSIAQSSVAPGWTASPAISYSKGIGPWTNDMHFTDDGKFLAFLGAGGEIGITNTHDQKTYFPDSEKTLSSWTSHISFLPNLHFLLIGGDSNLGYLNIDDQKMTSLPFGHINDILKLLGGSDYYHMIGNMVTNPKGGTVITLDEFSKPVLWNSYSLSPTKILPMPNINKAAYDVTGKYLITNTPTLSVLDVQANLVVKELFPNSTFKSVNDIQVSGNCVAVAHDFSTFPADRVPAIEVLDFISGKSILHLEFKGAHALEKQKNISMDGSCKTMLVTDFDQSQLIDITSGKVIAVFAEHLTDSDQEVNENHISAGAISKDGKAIAIGYRKVMIFRQM